jgi:hypothetical protein
MITADAHIGLVHSLVARMDRRDRMPQGRR